MCVTFATTLTRVDPAGLPREAGAGALFLEHGGGPQELDTAEGRRALPFALGLLHVGSFHNEADVVVVAGLLGPVQSKNLQLHWSTAIVPLCPDCLSLSQLTRSHTVTHYNGTVRCSDIKTYELRKWLMYARTPANAHARARGVRRRARTQMHVHDHPHPPSHTHTDRYIHIHVYNNARAHTQCIHWHNTRAAACVPQPGSADSLSIARSLSLSISLSLTPSL